MQMRRVLGHRTQGMCERTFSSEVDLLGRNTSTKHRSSRVPHLSPAEIDSSNGEGKPVEQYSCAATVHLCAARSANSTSAANVVSTNLCQIAQDSLSCNAGERRSEEHTSELQSLMRISYAVFCLKKKTTHPQKYNNTPH